MIDSHVFFLFFFTQWKKQPYCPGEKKVQPFLFCFPINGENSPARHFNSSYAHCSIIQSQQHSQSKSAERHRELLLYNHHKTPSPPSFEWHPYTPLWPSQSHPTRDLLSPYPSLLCQPARGFTLPFKYIQRQAEKIPNSKLADTPQKIKAESEIRKQGRGSKLIKSLPLLLTN